MQRSSSAVVRSAVASAVALFVLGLGASCSSSSDTPDPSLADVVFEGQATDEGLAALLAAKVLDDPTRAANFSWQSAGDQLPLTPIPLFCWHIGGATASAPPPAPRHRAPSEAVPLLDPTRTEGEREGRAAPSTAGFPAAGFAAEGVPAEGWMGRGARSLAELLLSGVPAAYAHGTPMSGPGYLLVFSTSKDPKLLRVFTTGTEYTPNEAAWKKITTTGELVHVVITNAEFDQNRIAQDGGPYRGTEISFTFPAM